jgi:hypothetical protein
MGRLGVNTSIMNLLIDTAIHWRLTLVIETATGMWLNQTHVGIGAAEEHGRSSKMSSGAPGTKYEADVLQTIRPGGDEREPAK